MPPAFHLYTKEKKEELFHTSELVCFPLVSLVLLTWVRALSMSATDWSRVGLNNLCLSDALKMLRKKWLTRRNGLTARWAHSDFPSATENENANVCWLKRYVGLIIYFCSVLDTSTCLFVSAVSRTVRSSQGKKISRGAKKSKYTKRKYFLNLAGGWGWNGRVVQSKMYIFVYHVCH